jgi:predicted transcriptional regulator
MERSMSTVTTLKLPDDLRARIAEIARELDKTPHAFMVEAIAEQTERAERRHGFVTAALEAEREVAEDGAVYDADDVFAWLRARVTGSEPRRPRKRNVRT